MWKKNQLNFKIGETAFGLCVLEFKSASQDSFLLFSI